MDFRDVNGKKVKAPKEYSLRPASYGLLIEGGKVLFIQPNWDKKYCLPGGSIDSGETPTKALEREFLEETGYKVNVNSKPLFIDSHFFIKEFTNG